MKGKAPPHRGKRRPAHLLETRVCLKCQKEFGSEGNHERICQSCKHTHAWRSGVDFEMPARTDDGRRR